MDETRALLIIRYGIPIDTRLAVRRNLLVQFQAIADVGEDRLDARTVNSVTDSNADEAILASKSEHEHYQMIRWYYDSNYRGRIISFILQEKEIEHLVQLEQMEDKIELHMIGTKTCFFHIISKDDDSKERFVLGTDYTINVFVSTTNRLQRILNELTADNLSALAVLNKDLVDKESTTGSRTNGILNSALYMNTCSICYDDNVLCCGLVSCAHAMCYSCLIQIIITNMNDFLYCRYHISSMILRCAFCKTSFCIRRINEHIDAVLRSLQPHTKGEGIMSSGECEK